MDHKAETTGAAAGGVVAMVATLLMVGELAADTPDTTSVEGQRSTSVHQYTGPRTADAADAWLGRRLHTSVPITLDPADAAERWLAAHRDG